MSQKSSHKTRSVASVSSKASSISSAAAIARAKAEAATTRAAFAEQEMQLKIEKPRLEARLEKLAAEKEAAATIAEAEFLEAIEYPKTQRPDSIPDFIHRSADQSEVKVQNPSKQCPIHQKPHPLQKCRAFREKPVEDRKRFLKENGICYKCCASTSHFAKDCKVSVKCTECDTTDHRTALHPGPAPWSSQSTSSDTKHGGEEGSTATTSPVVTSQCTEVCKGTLDSRSCSKICLVRVYPKGHKDKAVKMYAILDDQSNRSLARSTFFDIFKIQGPSTPYSLKTCAGTTSTMGRKATGFQIESLDGQTCLPLPTIIECNQIPDNRSEIPTPDVASYHAHLKCMAHLIPEINHQAQIILLLGRDILQVRKVRHHINGPHNAPFAQRLDLGWVIIGDVCLGRTHAPTSVTSMLTNMLENGRPSLYQACHNNFHVKEQPYSTQLLCPYKDLPCDSYATSNIYEDQLGCTVFQRTKKDNQVAMSIEDKLFLDIMHDGFVKDETNSWVAPLPFRSPRQRLPNNRVLRIRRSVHPNQWHYVPTDQNPNDHATRAVAASHLKNTTWLSGPKFLYNLKQTTTEAFELVSAESDVEIRPLGVYKVPTLHTTTSDSRLGSHRFQQFSTWKSLVRAITCLTHITRSFRSMRTSSLNECKGWNHCTKVYAVSDLEHSRNHIIFTVQQQAYSREIACLTNKRPIHKDSVLNKLDPFIDSNGLLRVGGRLKEAKLEFRERSPLIIPGYCHIAALFVKHYHNEVRHQGRLFTEGALRTAGLWIISAKRLVSSIIFKCVTCRKLRGLHQTQKMADLPADRLGTEPPFTNVGLDVFGPWSVTTVRTRGGQVNSKRWAVIFTCMSIRAIHIEVIESLDTSSFINALRRFIAIRGPVKQIRSDRGTNFVGAAKELKIPSNVDYKSVERFLSIQSCTWTFNPQHSSHMGGSWERMIGIVRRILDSIFLQNCNLHAVSRSTRCSVLKDTVTVQKAETRPPLNVKLKCKDWTKKYLKTDFTKLLWTNEMRVTLDSPDGWARSWISNGHRAPL
ncbi:uncharacterized protein LOC128497662 [Spea bombifrons]|uniref:uncharacterized protein LOC128497662 n=1 Tax=Spea bombifrons TaxID=233779 RepID=UPI00234B9232|nr:uncharacterized protein LOC128497662 [Spea bombifrons]